MNIIDLSHEINNNSPVYPGDDKTELTIAKYLKKDGYNAYKISSFFHTATHIETPSHLLVSNKTITSYDITHFIGGGVVLNFEGKTSLTLNDDIKNIDLEDKIVLLYTGFDKNYHMDSYFKDHPLVTEELTNYLISKKIRILGIDFPSPDCEPYLMHEKLFKNNILIIENLTNLKKLLSIKRFNIHAFPLKMNTEASFVRVIAIET